MMTKLKQAKAYLPDDWFRRLARIQDQDPRQSISKLVGDCVLAHLPELERRYRRPRRPSHGSPPHSR